MGVTAMKMKKQLVAMIGVLAFGAGLNAVTAEAATGKCKTEECACDAALKQNTIEALEAFLKAYPQSTSSGQGACAALGVPSRARRP